MALDRHWINIEQRWHPDYVRGVDAFLDFAFEHSAKDGKIKCPCQHCKNFPYRPRDEVRLHLFRNGFLKSYIVWNHHGEHQEAERDELAAKRDEPVELDGRNNVEEGFVNDGLVGLLNDIFGTSHDEDTHNINGDSSIVNDEEIFSMDRTNPNAAIYYRLLSEAKEKLHPNCDHTKLETIIRLLLMKNNHRWTNRSFDNLLEFLRELIPSGKQTLPTTYNGALKYIADLGLHYERYDVCKNNCTLYWGPNADATRCQVCGLSRWKSGDKSGNGKPVPHKVLRYFPIIPRLQRLFMSSKTALNMRWYKEQRVDDGIMRHPADTPAWKSFDEQHALFASDPRNVRLGLATDGFQPFGKLSSQHSIWPIVLFPYNLPPWMCMKQPYFMVSMIIPGPHSPGVGIDVFLQPLIEELKKLWDVGVQTYDAHEKKNFTLRAAILWTISDFPGLADLSGYSTRGYKACPSCHKHTTSRYLPGSRKMCYLGSRRFLPMRHRWRKNTKSFDGSVEMREKPKQLTGDEILDELESFNQRPFGRGTKRKYNESKGVDNWRKKSIFFELPYWKTLLIRHNLDVMHIEKNVFDNCLGTIMNINGKTKDTVCSRYDLVSMGIRSELHPEQRASNVEFPVARYELSKKEKEAVCNMLANLKTPDGFLSKISRCVNVKDCKISGLKSHDCHVFMQRLLPLAVRGFLPKDVCEPLVELSAFFRDLCSKSLNQTDLSALESKIVLTLCKLEMIFPPSFFDVMVHLCIHLAGEAKIAGPVQFRWMYPVERFLRTLKSYVRNNAQPEASIAEALIVDECLTFCSMYMEDIDTKFNRPPRNDENLGHSASVGSLEMFSKVGRPIGKSKYKSMDPQLREAAHLYVLNNCEDVWPFIEEFKNSLAEELNHSELIRRFNSQFPGWFHDRIVEMHKHGLVSDDMLYLAKRPSARYKTYSGYIVNGFRFHTATRQECRKTQNSGVLCRGDDNSEKEYYGILEEVWELEYVGRNNIYLFKCAWFDVHHKLGCRTDNYSITSVKANRRLKTSEPFILASQAEQVFYVADPKDSNWMVVLKAPPRDTFNVPTTSNEENLDIDDINDEEVFQEVNYDTFGRATVPLDTEDDIPNLNRVDVAPQKVRLEIAEQLLNQIRPMNNSDVNLVDREQMEYQDTSDDSEDGDGGDDLDTSDNDND